MQSPCPGIAQQIAEQRSETEKAVENVVHWIGSLPFLWINLVVFGLWIAANILFLHWDNREFALLALFAGIEALLLTILVLAKQNRDETDSDFRTDRILQNTTTTENELRHLRERVDALTTALYHNTATADKNSTLGEKEPPHA